MAKPPLNYEQQTLALARKRPLPRAADLAELQRMLALSGVGSAAESEGAEQEAYGLGLFARLLVGMDRDVA